VDRTEQWERVKELFKAALQRKPEERADSLAEACGSDVSPREEIDSGVRRSAGIGSGKPGPAAPEVPGLRALKSTQ
jgi:bisphosphoglycerate-independent phosphoglycerate mutase (AlkP superfamily)